MLEQRRIAQQDAIQSKNLQFTLQTGSIVINAMRMVMVVVILMVSKQQSNPISSQPIRILYFWQQACKQQAISLATILSSSSTSFCRASDSFISRGFFCPFLEPSALPLPFFCLPALPGCIYSFYCSGSPSPSIFSFLTLQSSSFGSLSVNIFYSTGLLTSSMMSSQYSSRQVSDQVVSMFRLWRKALKFSSISWAEYHLFCWVSTWCFMRQWMLLGCSRKVGLGSSYSGKLSADMISLARLISWLSSLERLTTAGWASFSIIFIWIMNLQKWYTMSLQDLFSLRCSDYTLTFEGRPIGAESFSSFTRLGVRLYEAPFLFLPPCRSFSLFYL